jgi:hypothetical protein
MKKNNGGASGKVYRLQKNKKKAAFKQQSKKLQKKRAQIKTSTKVVKVEDTNSARIRMLNDRLKMQYKNDLRGPFSQEMSLESRVVNPTIPIAVEVSANAFATIILGVVSHALYRGWSLDTLDDSFPYQAWVYQSQFLIQAAIGGKPYAGNVPRWLNYLCQAFIKTHVNYRGGEINYNFVVPDSMNTNYMQTIGPPAYQICYNLGIKTSSLGPNGLIPVMGPPATYTEEKGQVASQNLWLFLESQYKNNPICAMEPFNVKNEMTKDISAYAFFMNGPGGGMYNTGGWFKRVFCEVQPGHPIFSCIAPVPTSALLLDRGYVKYYLGSGDGVMLGGLLSGQLRAHQLSYKTPVVPKFIDFLELADVYALTLMKALQLKTQQSFFVTEMQNNSNYFNDHCQCPLTLQEFLLLFRATVMLAITDNYCLQGIYPRSANSNSNEFVVYPTGVNTVPIYLGNMMLIPKLLQENILALRSRTVVAGVKGKYNPVMVKSCLGQYYHDALSTDDYMVNYTYADQELSSNVFYVNEAEVPVSLIDGATSGSSSTGTVYLAINDPSYLVNLAAKYNQWIQSLGNFIRDLNSISTDGGVRALSVIGMTQHWQNIVSNEEEKLPWKKTPDELLHPVKKPVNNVKRESEEKIAFRKHISSFSVPSAAYGTKKSIAVSVGYQVFDIVWTQFQQYWVCPINCINPPTNDLNNTAYLKMAILMREPRQISEGAGSVQFASLGGKHNNMAALMVKTPFAATSSQDLALRELANKSQSGILGGLVESIAGAVGHESVNVAAKLLGQAIPI